MQLERPLSTLTLAALALVAGSSQAQTATTSADLSASSPVQTLRTVTVRASADASADGLQPVYPGGQVARGGRAGVLGSLETMATPFAITSYTQALIQDQQAHSIADVLQNDPAVRVARGFGNYQQTYLVRGLPVFSDDMAYNGLYGLLPRQYLGAELVERVEVLRGANAFLNGAAPGGSGLGGAINVMPKRAPDAALNEVTLGVDSGGSGYAAVDLARRFGPDRNVGVRLNALRRDGETEVNDAHRELSLLSLGLDYRNGALRVSADLGHQDHRLRAAQPSVTFAPGVAIQRAPDADRRLAQPWTHSDERDTFGTLRAEYDLTRDWTVWGAYGARHGDERTDLANPTVVDAAGTLNTLRFTGTRRDRISTGEVGLRGRLQTGEIGHTLVLSAARYRAKTNAPFAFADFAGVTLGRLSAPATFAPAPATALVGKTVTDTRTSSLAIADTVSLLRDSLLVTIGARQQTFNDGPYDASRVTPVAGVVFKVNNSVSVYGSYVEGLVRGDIAPQTSGFPAVAVVNAGEVFAPYRTRQRELGVKLDTGRLGATFSVFDSATPGYAVNPATDRFEQTDRQKNTGAELTVFGVAATGLRLLGGASVLKAELDDGRRAIGAPQTQFNLGADWTVPGVPGLSIDGRVVHTSSQYADAANTQQVPAWTRFDLGARYVVDLGAQHLTLRARVDNVANRSHWASAGGFPGAGYLVLGAPRTVSLTGTLSF